MADHHTVVVVGAGSAGAVVAARLSENPDIDVVVLEAGATFPDRAAVPAELLDPADLTASLPGHPHNWAMSGSLTGDWTSPIPRGKVIGGSSAINGAYFVRATIDDFDHWVTLGNDRWGWNDVLPFFRRSEHDLDYAGELHGADGPVPVQRPGRARAPDFDDALVAACRQLGFPDEPDKNAGGAGGVGPVPCNVADGLRMSSALTHLLPAMGRPNLSVVGEALVTCVRFDGARAVGVDAVVDGTARTFAADEVVMSAGALRSPHLLMLSGVGPADHLRAHGIDVVHDAAGVGQNLVDHPELMASYRVKCPLPEMPGAPLMTSSLNWASELGVGRRSTDLEILPMVQKMGDAVRLRDGLRRPVKTLRALWGTTARAVANQILANGHPYIVAGVLQEESRGTVTLASSDPGRDPVVQHRFLSTDSDRIRFAEVARTLHEVFTAAPMQAHRAEVLGLGDAVAGGDGAVDDWVRNRLYIAGHPSCTCRMGPDDDPAAVVDQTGSVRGVEGLRVIDTSIFPHIPSRGPNATVVMMAERIAAMIVDGSGR